MITPTHKDVHPPFRHHFNLNFNVRVDKFAGISAIIGQCTARSTVAGDTMNYWCTWGAVLRDFKGIEECGLCGNHP
jgi:hypothetical protein